MGNAGWADKRWVCWFNTAAIVSESYIDKEINRTDQYTLKYILAMFVYKII